jgi:hypothetical protein
MFAAHYFQRKTKTAFQLEIRKYFPMVNEENIDEWREKFMGLSLNLQFSQLIKHVNIYIGS